MRIRNRTGDDVFRSYIIVIAETVEDITQVTLISMMIQLRKFKAMKTEITTQAEVMSKYQRKESSSSFFKHHFTQKPHTLILTLYMSSMSNPPKIFNFARIS